MGLSDYDILSMRVRDLLDENDWATAYTEIQDGIASGKTDAMVVLAELYIFGIGVPQDGESAIKYLKKATAEGNGRAAFFLHQLYTCGDDNIPNFVTDKNLAREYLIKSAELDYPYAYALLANSYYFGEMQFPQDDDLAFHWSVKAAKTGNEYGAELLGNCYEFGKGTSQDPAAAIYWYRQAAAAGLSSSKGRLGFVLSGLGKDYSPTQDMLEEGYKWACEAVEEGDVDAHVVVGYYLADGILGVKDQDKGYYYIKLAADNGNETAKNLLTIFRKNIYGKHYIP